jgi:two-component system OmpR family response regulator
LLARLHALLRRSQPANTPTLAGGLTLDKSTRRALLAGEPLELSGREWTLLELLVQQRDKVVTKEQIHQAWSDEGGETGGGNSIEVYIHRLRRKLEGARLVIRTVRGLGYLLEAEA